MLLVNPIHYRLRLEPDLVTFKFKGLVEIQLDIQGQGAELALDAVDLEIQRCQFSLSNGFTDCAFKVDTPNEKLLITLPSDRTGKISVKIDYQGQINNKMAGFYRSKTVLNDQETYIALTQFGENDARRAFPCLDHPAQKAVFELELIIASHLTAISNCPIEKEEVLTDGRKRVKFQATPKMSTYLVFFSVGEFAFLADAGQVQVRVAALPSMLEYAKYSLDFGRKSLSYSEDYYGIPYPLPKLDLIAIADFAFGAMENWGAITFRENALLHYPGITSKAGEERICEVIAHEIAHQWFGDLVTPSDWKYLWLNESFATYFGYGVVDHYYPEWEVWDQFVHEQVDIALQRDAYQETTPIEIAGTERVAINLSTSPIIYSKGGSMLRMIEAYIGDRNFQNGLQHYLKKFEYACATSHDLWDAFEEASAKPISRMMKAWVEQPGFPLLIATRSNNSLTIRQERFTYLLVHSEQVWPVPLVIKCFYRDGSSKSITLLLESSQTTLELDPEVTAYKLNDGQRGFFRVHYQDNQNLTELGTRVLNKTLPPLDRWGLDNDLYALFRKGSITLADYLDFFAYYRNENAWLPLLSISDNLLHAYLVMDPKQRARITAIAKPFLARVMDSIGYEPRLGEKHGVSILREQIIWLSALLGLKSVVTLCLEKFQELMQKGKIHEDLMKSIMKVAALQGNQATFTWFEKILKTTPSEHTRTNITIALGCFQKQELIEQAKQYILSEIPARNIFIAIGSLTTNPHAIPGMWDWYLANLKKFEAYHPLHYERIIASIIPICGIGKEQTIRNFFNDYLKKNDKFQDAVKWSLERLEVNLRMRGRI
jgi:tricorn protease interacting factor F2/3